MWRFVKEKMISNPQTTPKETSPPIVPTYRTSGTLALPETAGAAQRSPRPTRPPAPASPTTPDEQSTSSETATKNATAIPLSQPQRNQKIEAQPSEPKRSPKTLEPKPSPKELESKSKSPDIKNEPPVIKSESPRQVVYPCTEIKRQINYGTRTELPPTEGCEHIQIIGGPECEKCCRPISWHNSVLSLHCGWHHQFLHCSACKQDIDEHVVYEGLPYCNACYNRIIGDHASQMAAKHTDSK